MDLAQLLGLVKGQSAAKTGVPAGVAGNGRINLPQQSQQPQGQVIGGPSIGQDILQAGLLKKLPQLPQAQYAQYMNADGTGGGFGPNNPSQWQNQVPVGQTLSAQDIQKLPQNVQPLAQIYAQNPQDPRVAHIDPAIFGYAPDNSTQTQPTLQPQGGFGGGIAGSGLINLPQQTPLHSLLNRY